MAVPFLKSRIEIPQGFIIPENEVVALSVPIHKDRAVRYFGPSNKYIDFDNSLSFSPRLVSKSKKKNIRALAEKIIPEIHYKSNKLQANKLDALENILCNVIKGADHLQTVAISLTPGAFTMSKFYYKKYFSYSIYKETIDQLVELGYLNIKKGIHFKAEGKSRKTRIWARNRLLDLISRDNYVPEYKVIPYCTPVILKDKDKHLIHYKLSTKTWKLILFLNKYNDFMNKQEVTLCKDVNIDDKEDYLADLYSMVITEPLMYPEATALYNELSRTDKIVTGYDEVYGAYHSVVVIENKDQELITNVIQDDKSIETIEEQDLLSSSAFDHLTSKKSHKYKKYGKLRTNLHRVFNIDFNRGGRFYGAEYQAIPEGLRKNILINGNPTVEIDYSAMHPTIIYNQNNLPLEKDPYDIFDNSILRGGVKLLTNMTINAEQESEAFNAFKNEINGIKIRKERKSKNGTKGTYIEIDYEKKDEYALLRVNFNNVLNCEIFNYEAFHSLLRKIIEENPVFEKYLCTGKGLELQNIDSQIAENILKRLLKKKIPVLCIHDSFIVETQYQDELIQAMNEEYSKVMNGFKCNIKIK